MSLSDQDRKSYEAYLLATTQEERQDAIKKLIPGSQLYYSLYFIDRFKQVGSKLSEDDLKILEQYKKKYQTDHAGLEKIQARLRLLKYDDAETDAERQQILGEIQSNYLGLSFDHYKPEDIQRMGGEVLSSHDEGSALGSDISEDEFVQQSQKKTSVLEYNNYFSKDKIKQYFIGNKNEDYISTNALNTLPTGWEHDLDFTTYSENSVYQFVCSNPQNRLSNLVNESFYATLKSYFTRIFEENKHFQLDQSLCNSMTIKQLDKIESLHPKIKSDKIFIGSYFQKQFNEELSDENQAVWTQEEKRTNLITLYSYAKSKDMPRGLQSSLLIEILQLGVKINSYDETLFREYLQIPLTGQANVFKSKEKSTYQDTHWNAYIGNVQSTQSRAGQWSTTQTELINQYLEHFCLQKSTLESFKDEFDTSFLKNIEEKISILNSDDMTNLSVDLKKYQAISQEVICRFLESNKEIFKVEEEVVLTLEIKNIQTLYVKIFEFNTETYYKKTLQPFNTGVNLDGLIASNEKAFEYKNPSNKKFTETFQFPELVGKIGLFIIEFIGNGMSSRAVVKKGSLSLIHRPTIAGHLAYVLDENKKICTGTKTGIYFDGQYFETIPDKGGKIFIPYGKSRAVGKAILMNNGFAQLSDFERLTEDYTFNTWIHINTESILIGNKASVILKPYLSINERQASVEILKNAKLTLTTISYIDAIPVTKTFENIKFKNNREYIVDFQVPPYLQSISVSLDTEVQNISQQKNVSFNASKVFTVTTHQHGQNMSELFLRKENGEYYVCLMGKNGEPKANVNIKLKFMHLVLGERSMQQSVVLNTDKDGKVKLGQLKKILFIDAKVDLFNLKQEWFLPTDRQNLTYPSNVDGIENQTFEFPILNKRVLRKNMSLIKINREVVLEDLFERIIFEKQEGKDYNKIKIANLQDGNYILDLKKIGKKISITINKGQYWDNDSFILKRNCLFENKAPLKMIKIANIKVEENKKGTSDVQINLEDFTQQTRVHVYACQFQPNISLNMFATINKQIAKQQSKTVFPFAMWSNIFLSNRELSDEFRYVFDRKYAQRQLGNTLERPRLVLKRAFLQATRINQESLKQGQSYQNQNQPVQDVQYQRSQNFSQNIAPRSYAMNNKQQQSYNGHAYNSSSYSGDHNGDHFNYDMLIEALSQEPDKCKILEFQNFLKIAPYTEFNLVPAADGSIRFQANFSPFTQLYVVAIDQNSVAQKQIDLNINQIQKRDLSLISPLDHNKGYTESRTTTILLKNDTHFIEDITSTETQLIDDLVKVKGVLEELMRTRGNNYQGVFKDLCPIFMKWNKLELEEKNKQYTKWFCHELNIFIYFKDRDYFQSIARTLIEHKMEKTFIDFYLLGDYDSILEYANLERLNILNALEKCFLVDALMKKGRESEAKRIAEFITLQKDVNEQFDANTYNKVFDTVLNLNMLKIQGEGGDDLDSMLRRPPTNNPGNSVAFSDIPDESFGGGGGQFNSYFGFQGTFASQNQQAFHNFANMSQVPMDLYDALPMSNQYQQQQQQRQRPQMEMTSSRNFQPRSQMIQPSSCTQDACFDDFDDNSYVPQAYAEAKAKVKVAFEEIQQTSEYTETNYYKQTAYSHSTHLIAINSFWADYAVFLSQNQKEDRQFLSSNFIKNADNLTSSLLTLALIDLPFDSETHGYKTNESRGVEVKACNNIILFKKEVRDAPLEVTNDIMVTHRYQAVDQHNESESAIPDELLINKAYSCEIITTNVSPKQKEFSILYQIPQNSLPLEMTKYMKSIPQSLSPYTTNKMKFYFYFPNEGSFIHFPSNVSFQQKVTARANVNTLKVVKQLSIAKKETFRDILAGGKKEDVLEFLRTVNLLKGERGFNFNEMLWMLKDKSFYKKVILTLRERFIYNDQVWAYSFFHKDDEKTCREYLMLNKPAYCFSFLGPNFSSKLVTVQPIDTEFKHLDYFPMINSRAHQVGDTEMWSLNENFKATYEKFLQAMIDKKKMTSEDRMNFAYYLLLQDRVNDSIAMFKSVDLTQLKGETLKIQYDYMNAYFDFFTGSDEGFKVARAIVRKYEDHPNASWRLMFLEILDQLNEYDGEVEESMDFDPDNMTEEQKKQKYKQSVKKEPSLSVEISTELAQIQIDVANIKAIAIKFYIIDVEILFSRTPFLKENTEEFSYVKPCYIIEKEFQAADLNTSIDTITTVNLNAGSQKVEIDIPEHLRNSNMVIEINGEGKQIFKTYYSSQIKVNLLEAYGELKVTDKDGKPLPKVYVKVFSQKKGNSTSQATFFKDGYTDIRGKFEYAQTSSNKLKEVQRFAVLVLSDELGSSIRECNPPKGSDQATDDTTEEPAYRQQKAERIINKIANCKSKASKPQMKK